MITVNIQNAQEAENSLTSGCDSLDGGSTQKASDDNTMVDQARVDTFSAIASALLSGKGNFVRDAGYISDIADAFVEADASLAGNLFK